MLSSFSWSVPFRYYVDSRRFAPSEARRPAENAARMSANCSINDSDNRNIVSNE